MTKKKPKFYVVWEGHAPGVYKTWAECQQQTAGFSKAKFKSFGTLGAAQAAFADDVAQHVGKAGGTGKRQTKTPKHTLAEFKEFGIDLDALAVDAACKGNPGPLEYQGVEISSDVNLFHQGPFEDGTVNIGEFLAIVHALALLSNSSNPDRVIYSDSRVGISWVKQAKCKTKAPQTIKNKRLFQLIKRAEKWLQENEFSNPIKKWETKLWGEIPADFGRK